MGDTQLPAAGWYADGSTVGVRRWFDGTAWTEHTQPDEVDAGARTVSADSRFASTAGNFGGDAVPSRNGLAMSPAALEERAATFASHRLADARRTRRGAIGAFCSALALLGATAGTSLALQSPTELWLAGGAGAAYLVWRAGRDYGRAVFRGAPRLPLVAWAVATVGLVAAVALFVAVPVEAAQQSSHTLDGITGLTGIGGPPGVPGTGG